MRKRDTNDRQEGGRVTAASEIEIKFLIAQDSLGAVKRNPVLSRQSTRTDLQSTYYDTPTLDLQRRGFGLRVRSTPDGFIQTVKRQAGVGLFDRGEWEIAIPSEQPEPSAWTDTPIARILSPKRQRALVPIFISKVQRTTRLWKEGRSLIEISLDEGSIVAGVEREPIEEIEFELKKGDEKDLFASARRFSADAILRLSFDSKAARGYQLFRPESKRLKTPAATVIAPDETASIAFAQALRGCLSEIGMQAELLRKQATPAPLHKLRIGVRRLLSVFVVFRAFLVQTSFARLKAEARWLVKELNPARTSMC